MRSYNYKQYKNKFPQHEYDPAHVDLFTPEVKQICGRKLRI